MLGILTLDTRFPRIPGDVGCPQTFPFEVKMLQVEGATVEEIVHRRKEDLLPAFIAAGRELASQGCAGLTTTCGFLARWQRELTAALPVPVFTSALLVLPMLERLLPSGMRPGSVTYSAADLTRETLEAVGAKADTPIEGVDPLGYFAKTIRFGATTLDRTRMAADTAAAAQRLVATHPDVGAIVLECANMPPYRAAVAAAVGMPVYDAAQVVTWFHAGLSHRLEQEGRADLW